MSINVTQTFLPPIEEYTKILSRAWNKKWLTNRGELVLELEKKIIDYEGLSYATLTNNGTIPLQIALKLLKKGTEIITTPYSYIATTSILLWDNFKPVFVDIEKDYFTIDPQLIEEAITPSTSAILATHVYGNPCDVIRLEQIARKHNLLLIYDCAHGFGVRYENKSLLSYGDISTCSFHATKIFQTGEGGMWTTPHNNLHKRMYSMHKFGHDGPQNFDEIGINGKISELHAAMGLTMFPYMQEIIERRKRIYELYIHLLSDKISTIKIRPNTQWNYHYFPILIDDQEKLAKCIEKLEEHNIFTRRYFYPSLNTIPFVNYVEMPVSESIASRVLCLPMFTELTHEEVTKISTIVNAVIND